MGPLKTTSDSFKWGRAKAINMSSCKLNEPCIIKSLSTFRSSTRVESGRVYGLIIVMYQENMLVPCKSIRYSIKNPQPFRELSDTYLHLKKHLPHCTSRCSRK